MMIPMSILVMDWFRLSLAFFLSLESALAVGKSKKTLLTSHEKYFTLMLVLTRRKIYTLNILYKKVTFWGQAQRS